MDELLRARLLSSVAGVPADWGMTAQGISAPRLVLYRISGGDDYSSSGRTVLTRDRVQIDCYAAGVGAAKLLARQVKTALSGWRSGIIRGVFLDNERDLAPDTDGAGALGRVSLDFFIITQE